MRRYIGGVRSSSLFAGGHLDFVEDDVLVDHGVVLDGRHLEQIIPNLVLAYLVFFFPM